MDLSARSDVGVEHCDDVISLSDDTDESPSNQNQDHEEDEEEQEVEAMITEVQDIASELEKMTEEDGSDKLSNDGSKDVGDGVRCNFRCGSDKLTGEMSHQYDANERDEVKHAEAVGQSGGQTLQSGSDRHQDESGVMPSTKMEDRRGAERCKPVIASTSDQPPTNDVGRALETMSADVEVPRETTDEAKPLGDATVVSEVFEDPRIPLTVTVPYYRSGRARRPWNRRSAGGGGGSCLGEDPGDPQGGHAPAVRAPSRGRGSRRRSRTTGPRSVAPLSLRQFYDSGGRDYVEYLLRHIQADTTGGGRSRQLDTQASRETPHTNSISSSASGTMPTLTPVSSFPAHQIHPPPYPSQPVFGASPERSAPITASGPVAPAIQGPVSSAHAHHRAPLDQQNLEKPNKYSSSSSFSAAAGSRTEYGAVDLSSRTRQRSRGAAATGSRSQLPAEMTSPASTTRPPLPGNVAVAEYQRLSHGDVRSWSVDDVSKFIAMVPGCSEYAETFFREKIDGISLMHLSDWHLLNVLNMRLGPALRLRIAIDAVRVGGATPPTAATAANWITG